jgi:hypothetical protein
MTAQDRTVADAAADAAWAIARACSATDEIEAAGAVNIAHRAARTASSAAARAAEIEEPEE